MNEIKQQQLLSILDHQIAACAAEVKALELDLRRDEAVFARIRLNVYDIFRTVYKTALKQDDADAFFLEKLDQIPENWRNSLHLARQHGNEEKAHIEQIKLDTAAQIRSIFHQVREVQP